jgi:hypothetical protein
MAKKESIEKYKSFEKWKTQEVQEEFGIHRNLNEPRYLTDWLHVSDSLSAEEIRISTRLQKKLLLMTEAWNEFDMSIVFIGPLFDLIDFQTNTYRTFFNHQLKAVIKNKEITGRVDCMLAKGWQIPQSPLFFLQEYKPESGPNGDPLGQLLAEMVTAQYVNKMPNDDLYGCYIIGRNWFFVVLQGNEYAVSNSFNATTEHIFQIVGLLKKIKTMFEQKIGYLPA